MTDQPALFETVITPYGATYAPAPASHGAAYGQGEHAAVTAPEHAEDIDRRFDAWLRANPHVLAEFVRRALAYQRAGYRTLRGKRIIEDMRDDYQAHIATGGEPWKLNNTYTSRLVRAAEKACSQLARCFEQRELRS